MKGKGFRQINNQYFLAIMAADLTRSGSKVLLSVIHFTLGYNQRDTADISLSTFQNLTKLSRPAVKTAIKELIAYGLISEVAPETNRLSTVYKLNKDWRGKADLPSRDKADLPSRDVSPVNDVEIMGPEPSKTYPPDVENLPSRGQVPTPATVPLKKERKPFKENFNAPIDADVGVLFNKYKKIIYYYYKAYREHTGKPHPFMRAWRRARVVAQLESFADEKNVIGLKYWKILIDYHFRRRIKTDWRIYHFATPGVLENLFYKNLY